jgi:glucokinase
VTVPTVGCVDVGGTGIKVGVVSGGEYADAGRAATPRTMAPDGSDVVDEVVRLVEGLREQHPLDAVGVVVPGIVDAERGVGVWSENLGWRDVPFRRLLEERTGLPVAFGHDVRAGALAEARLGAGAGYRDVLFLPLGTGIAAGLVLDGVLLERPRPLGEIGHVSVGFPDPCVCGLTGCLEAVASASAVGRRYSARTGREATSRDVADLVRAGDADAVAVWSDAVEALATALAWSTALVAPDVVVVGGGLGRAGELLLDPLRAVLGDRLAVQDVPEIVTAGLGDLAGCRGAGLLALERLRPAA